MELGHKNYSKLTHTRSSVTTSGNLMIRRASNPNSFLPWCSSLCPLPVSNSVNILCFHLPLTHFLALLFLRTAVYSAWILTFVKANKLATAWGNYLQLNTICDSSQEEQADQPEQGCQYVKLAVLEQEHWLGVWKEDSLRNPVSVCFAVKAKLKRGPESEGEVSRRQRSHVQ